MDKPVLKLNGKEYSPKRPTMKLWRAVVEHDAETASLTMAEILSRRLEILAAVYGVDIEILEENIDVSDVLPAYNEAAKWILGLVFEKLDKIPNAAAGTGD